MTKLALVVAVVYVGCILGLIPIEPEAAVILCTCLIVPLAVGRLALYVYWGLCSLPLRHLMCSSSLFPLSPLSFFAYSLIIWLSLSLSSARLHALQDEEKPWRLYGFPSIRVLSFVPRTCMIVLRARGRRALYRVGTVVSR